MPQISVIMPVYNAQDYLGEAINSILNQTFSDFELLVLNDCSTDNSCAIVEEFTDKRIRLINSEKNTGIVGQLNKGLELAVGKYIARMDADDISHPERFEKQFLFLEAHPDTVLCGTGLQFIGTKSNHVTFPSEHEEITFQLLLVGNCIAHPTVMMRKSFLKERQIQYPLIAPAEDYALWIILAIQGARLANLPELLLQYRVHEKNESVVRAEEQKMVVRSIQDKYLMKFIPQDQPEQLALIRAFMDGDKNMLTPEGIRYVKTFKNNLLVSGEMNNSAILTYFSEKIVFIIQQADLSLIKHIWYFYRIDNAGSSLKKYIRLVVNYLLNK